MDSTISKGKGSVLIGGFATRHVAASAHNAGYEVCCVDNFCDEDLAEITTSCVTFDELCELQGVIEGELKKRDFSLLVVTSGAENLTFSQKVCGTDSKTADFFLDKSNIQEFFEKNGIPIPKILPEGVYPAMLKPCRGAGGWRNKIVTCKSEEEAWCAEWEGEPYIRQEIVGGIPCSVSCIADGKEARAISFNEQILRGGDGERAYGFSGAITPFKHKFEKEIVACAEKVVSLSGCVGSVGVDFMADNDRFYAIEINPRFQGTLDVVERATGIDIFDAHVNAARGVLPPKYSGSYRQYAARKVLFANRDLIVRDDLRKIEPNLDIADIPHKDSVIEEGGAVLSVYGVGDTRLDATTSLDKTIRYLDRYICKW